MSLKNKSLIALCLLGLTIGGVFFWKTAATSGITNNEEFNQKIRNSLSELSLPRSGESASVDLAPERLSNYTIYRSGVSLNQSNKDLLRQTEQRSWSDSKRVSRSQLAQVLTDVAFEKLVTFSDSDISAMAETLRGFNHPTLPAAFQGARSMVRLRANGDGSMEPEYFVSQLRYARDAQIRYNANRGPYPPLLIQSNRAALYNRMINEISARLDSVLGADPNFLGGSTQKNMTPMQAILITYSVVSNDMLVGNQAELQQKMASHQQTISEYVGQQYPSQQNYRAYGVNGYIYSSPVNYLLDDASVARVLNLINERSTAE